jgi:two-component system cell cycle response regulator
MTARGLVVDDIISNVKLLEAKLAAEYFEVVSALNGEQALARVAEEIPDIILLDVMMPGMDGFEVCRRIKANPKTAHVPIVMVTALDQPSDRITGLEAGADDFLTKPVDDTALFARVHSLVRLKMMTDELRMREETGQSMGLVDPGEAMVDSDSPGRILVVDDRPESVAWYRTALEPKNQVTTIETFDEALLRARGDDFDLIVVSLGIRAFDGLRLCSHLRSIPEARGALILVVVSEGETRKLAQALDMGVNDYLMRPVDRNELQARVRTQLRKKRYADRLRHNVQLSLEMAITDQLTGLHNRRYMARHLDTLMKNASPTKPISFLVLDIDYFKSVNDTHGHLGGDAALKTVAKIAERSVQSTRNGDQPLVARYGGEELAVILPGVSEAGARRIAEVIREAVMRTPIPFDGGELHVTLSAGVASRTETVATSRALISAADAALYRAKDNGRNRVEVTPST